MARGEGGGVAGDDDASARRDGEHAAVGGAVEGDAVIETAAVEFHGAGGNVEQLDPFKHLVGVAGENFSGAGDGIVVELGDDEVRGAGGLADDE